MKVTLFALFFALLMVGCGEWSNPSGGVDMTDTAPKKDAIQTAVDLSKLQDRSGVKYLPNEENPFTGRAESFYDNGQKQVATNYKDGKQDGLRTGWYESGQKRQESKWKDGKFMSVEGWKPNGERCPVTNVKDGNGVRVFYDHNGTERNRWIYKDGELVRAITPKG